MKAKIYLAGPITGLSFGESVDWRDYVKDQLDDVEIACFSPLRGKHYLSQETSLKDSYDQHIMSTQRFIFGRDTFDVHQCDGIFVNLLGAERVSIGTVMEITLAWQLRKPIILVMEDEGNVHEHSMLREACPFRVNNLEDGLHLVRQLFLTG